MIAADPLHIAMLSTRHFHFMAGGSSEEHARETMRLAWAAHVVETGATYTWADIADDVNVEVLGPGVALRDGWQMALAKGIASPAADQ
ncbi:hypothetical protein [Amycolatopsis sp. NPDC004079]|uniref:hypothetical protein n=1 Tax=Amycolatopsis sp. NPDC004079 TaxID=3154549 RepID=UPI0033BA34C5